MMAAVVVISLPLIILFLDIPQKGYGRCMPEEVQKDEAYKNAFPF